MPLTAETEALLKLRTEAGLRPIQELTPAEARAQMAQMRQAQQAAPEAVGSVEDRSIPGPAGQIPVRIYQPEGTGPFGTLVFFHGGGWVVGDLESHDGVARAITNAAGCCVVSVDYRLAPEHRYPAAADDCYAATVWVAEHAGELGVRADRIAVGGDSAGGNLAAAVALMARDRGGPAIVHQALIYPVTDCNFETGSYRANGTDYGLTEAGMRWFWDCYVSPEQAREPYASPLRAVDLSGLPPALVITAEYDPLRDEGEAYGKRLHESGVATTVHRYDGVVHGFVSQAAQVPEGREALAEVGAALRSALG